MYASDSINGLFADLLAEKLALPASVIVQVEFSTKNHNSKVPSLEYNSIKNADITSINQEMKSFTGYMVDDVSQEIVVNGKYTFVTQVLSAASLIRKGDIISKNNTIITYGAYENFPDYVPENLYGMQLKKTIGSGSIVKLTDLFFPISIKEKDTVDITYNSQNLYLKTKGIALQRGAIGDYIKIKNEKSGTILIGRITAKKTVEVKANNDEK